MAKTRRLYKLPEDMTCDEDEIKNGVTIDLVKKYIRQHQSYLQRYIYLDNLYKGFHDVYKAPKKPAWKPDNRLMANFPRFVTETFTGYGYGIPIKVSHPDENINSAFQVFGRNNEISDHNSEMVKKCCIFGHAFEYIYQNENAETKITAFNPTELFVVYDDKIKGRALFAIRYGAKRNKYGIRTNEYCGEILTREEITPFDADRKGEPQQNPYGYIPCIEWRLNQERIGLYEHTAGLVEVFSLVLGEKANDVEAFAEAYLAILGAEIDEQGIYKIRDNRIINLYGTDNAKDVLVQFLQKPTADGTQENLLDRLERLIFTLSMVVNLTDETFNTAPSGVALAFKLLAMDNQAATFDRKIEKSLRKRYKIFCSLSTNVSDPKAYVDLEVKTTRNVPQNLKEETEIVKSLEGITSRETQLSVLSIIQDPKAELEKIKNETAERIRGAIDERKYMN